MNPEHFSGKTRYYEPTESQTDCGSQDAGRNAVDLKTDAQSLMLPQCYPNLKIVHRRFQQLCRNKVLRSALNDLTNDLRKRGKSVKAWVVADRHGLPSPN